MKRKPMLTVLFIAAFTLLADLPADAACNDPGDNDREQRSLFGANRRRLRRAKSDRYRAFNYSNYTRHDNDENEQENHQNRSNTEYEGQVSYQPGQSGETCPHCNRRH